MNMTLSQQVAASAANTKYDRLRSAVIERTLEVLLDTLAVARVGAEDVFCAQLIDDASRDAGAGHSSLVRSKLRVGAALASTLNALPLTVLQADEGHRVSRGHPGIHVIPAALAIAEEVDASGAALIEAIVAGYDAAVNASLSLGIPGPGIHSHGTWGAFGAAVATSKLLGADELELTTVFDSVAAVPLAPWRGAVPPGGTIHHLYAAIGAHTGLLVARAVKAGATCPLGAYEAHYGSVVGSGQALAEANFGFHHILDGYIKHYPSCAHMHTALEAFENLRAAEAFSWTEIRQVTVETYRAAAELCEVRPSNNLAARFSTPFSLAFVAIHGELPLHPFTADQLGDSATLELADRVRMRADPALESGYPSGRPALVSVTLNDGRQFERSESVARGDDQRKLAADELEVKLHDLLGGTPAARLVAFRDRLPTAWSARELGRSLHA